MSERDSIAVTSHLQRNSRTANLSGKRFGKLVATEFVEMLPHGYAVWKYRCDCGRTVTKKARNAKNQGHCGCSRASKVKDIRGKRFGKLVAVKPKKNERRKEARWEFQCDCGGVTVQYPHSAKITRHCGCLTAERMSKRSTTHGMSHKEVYKTWFAMKARCNNPNNEHYHRYGGRGIIVCERWMESFENFIADMGDRPKGMTIERIDNDGNYEPSNCKWATRKEQQANRSVNRNITMHGRTQCISQWAEEYGINHGTIRTRLNNGWSPEDAITRPVNSKARNKLAKEKE